MSKAIRVSDELIRNADFIPVLIIAQFRVKLNIGQRLEDVSRKILI